MLAATSACGGGASTGDKGFVIGNGIITQLPVAQRKTPGTVKGTTLEGRPLDLKDYAGKVVVLNVWGSWCPPCRAEAPTLAAAARQLAPSGVAFVGVDTKDSGPDQALAFQERYHLPYPSFFDPAGTSLLAFHGTLNPDSIPSTVVIDKQGRVAASILGEVPSTRTLVQLVQGVDQ